MPRKEKPSYVVEIPLDTTPADERRLAGVFEAGKRLFNVLLQEGLKKVDKLRADPAWSKARKMPKACAEQRSLRNEAFRAVLLEQAFTDSAFQASAVRHKNVAGFDDRLGSHVTQKLGTRVFKALGEYLWGKRGRPRFKGRLRPLHSIEGKNNEAALRWDTEELFLVMDRSWGLQAKELRLDKDEWLWSALQGEVKYCRLVWRNVGTERRYYAQLVMDGRAPMKASLLCKLAKPGSTAGLDIGPSNIAWVTETEAGLFKFCAEVERPQRLIKQLQRQVDRQRRAANPDNYDEKGRAKKGCRSWRVSKRQRTVEGRLRSIQAKTAEQRANAHGRDINNLLAKARTFRHDGVSVKSLAKNYGPSIQARAPGHFMSELSRKADRAGGASTSVNVRQLKTSQYDHSTESFEKKPLSQRWHTFGDGRGKCQRDVYSAFLALHATQSVDADGVVKACHDPKALEAAWVKLEPALRAQGLFIPTGSNSVGERASIAPSRGPRQLQSSELPEPPLAAEVAGVRARRAARVKKFLGTTGLSLQWAAIALRAAIEGAPVKTRNHRPLGR